MNHHLDTAGAWDDVTALCAKIWARLRSVHPGDRVILDLRQAFFWRICYSWYPNSNETDHRCKDKESNISVSTSNTSSGTSVNDWCLGIRTDESIGLPVTIHGPGMLCDMSTLYLTCLCRFMCCIGCSSAVLSMNVCMNICMHAHMYVCTYMRHHVNLHSFLQFLQNGHDKPVIKQCTFIPKRPQ